MKWTRIVATALKEWQLMRKDIGGLSLLFVMPALLITIMALVQDAPFKDFQETKFDAIFVDHDRGQVAQQVKEGLLRSNHFNLIDSLHGISISDSLAKNLILQGQYSIAIIFPKGISAEIVNSGNALANHIGQSLGLPESMPHRELRKQQVEILFDPISKPTFKIAILNTIDKLITKSQSEIVLQRIQALNGESVNTDTSFNFEQQLKSVQVAEVPLAKKIKEMNSVQHNVPAWAIFGIFFLVIVISESLINERQQGSWTRIKLISGSFTDILIGMHIFYVLLGMIQFAAMLCVGVFLMPLLGLPALQLSDLALLALVVICISICATTFGLFLGSVFKTSNQALPVGAMSVVILSAIGGIWVPLEVLPDILKKVSVISPLRWSLEAVNNILLRHQGFQSIIMPCGMLFIGSVLLMWLSWFIERKRTL